MAKANVNTTLPAELQQQQQQDVEQQPRPQTADLQQLQDQSATADQKSADTPSPPAIDADTTAPTVETTTTTTDPQRETNKSRRLAKRAARTATEPSQHDAAHASKPKQRRELDVLNRLRWDERFDAADIIIGYEDRHSERGIIEIALPDWERESTADEFVPLHRIRYFSRRGDGEMLWHRALRIDRVFGGEG